MISLFLIDFVARMENTPSAERVTSHKVYRQGCHGPGRGSPAARPSSQCAWFRPWAFVSYGSMNALFH